MPAARVTDMQICPMVTPAPVPVPHVGVMISGPGVPTVLIGGMPAATLGDMTVCVGPPGTIIMGCPTVLIGTGGGGSGGAGGGAVKAAHDGAHSAIVGQPGPQAEGPHFIDIRFADSAGNPVTQVPYELTGVEGQVETGILTGEGAVIRGGLPSAGQYKVRLFRVYDAKWSVESAAPGDTVKLLASTEGYNDGTEAIIRIWKRDFKGPDECMAEIKTTVSGNKVESEWEYPSPEGEEEGADDIPINSSYSSPLHYFFVHVQTSKVRSGFLEYKDWIEIELKDDKGKPVPNEEYILTLCSGEIRKGTLDGNGYKREEKIPLGGCTVRFPNLPGSSEDS
jgi:uncharacterized Zn-binding protein involved in type VI secretion